MGQKMVTVLTNWSEEDEWGVEEYQGWRRRQSLFFDGGWRWL